MLSKNSIIKGLFLIFILAFFNFYCFSRDIFPDYLINKISQHKSWTHLLHYQKNLLGQYDSQADSPSFFFSADGKNNPKSELSATLQAFMLTNQNNDEAALCKFPARALFFKEYFPEIFKQLPAQQCPQFTAFKAKVKASSLSLVFSSYFLNRPVSTFGHTLIRFKQKNGTDLLDYASNYSAKVTTKNAFLYGLMGLIGGFKGEFALMPYFYKIREYNDYESRDLWDYELNLSPFELAMVLAHLWEMKQTYFDYYYMSENCSYHILGLLNVANPHWMLTERMPYLVIPVDSIKVLFEIPGLVKNVTFRPSKRRIFNQAMQKLDHQDRHILSKIIKQEDLSSLTTDIKKVPLIDQSSKIKKSNILDAAIEYYDYHHAEDVLLKKGEILNLKRKILLARAQTGITSKNTKYLLPENERPEISHPSRRISLGLNFIKELPDVEMSYRFNFHELLDLTKGHNPHSSIEMLNTTFELINHKRKSELFLKEVTLVNVESLFPTKDFDFAMSFSAIFFGAATYDEIKRQRIFYPAAHFGYGVSTEISGVLLNLMGITGLDIHKNFSQHYFRTHLGAQAKAFYQYKNHLSLQLLIKQYYTINFESKVKKARDISVDFRKHLHSTFSINAGLKLDIKNALNFNFKIFYFF